MNASSVIRKFQQPSLTCSSDDIASISKATEICNLLLRSHAERFVRKRLSEPVLYQYGNDSTPLVTKERYTVDMEHYECVRRGRNPRPFLAERFFIADVSGNVVVVFTDPQELGTKDHWPCFSCPRALMPLPRELGHQNTNVLSHCYDGALQSSLFRRPQQLCEALWEQSRDCTDVGQHWLNRLLTWVVGVVCVNHSVHNGLKWSVLSWTNNNNCMRSVFITIESLRNSYSLLVRWVGPWIASVVAYEDWDHPDIGEIWRVRSAILSMSEGRFVNC